MDILLPSINVGLFPDTGETVVGMYPSQEPIKVNMYSIGDMEPTDFFPNPDIKKK